MRKVFNVVPVLIAFTAILLSIGCNKSASTPATAPAGKERIVVIGGSATEIVYALGAGDLLVGVDTSSIYPEAATKLPQVGYQRTISAEGIIALKPTTMIILPDAGPPPAIQQIESAGIKIVRVPNDYSVDGAKVKIRTIAEALNRKEDGEKLVTKLDAEIAEAKNMVAGKQDKPKVLFLYSRGAGTTSVGGTGTPAAEMISLAGAVNAFPDFEGYKPLNSEALVAAQPDVILLPARALEPLGGIDGILALPGIASTPAGKNKKIITLDDMQLLGFTPRLAESIKELCTKLHQ